jgi:hypothetical protein
LFATTFVHLILAWKPPDNLHPVCASVTHPQLTKVIGVVVVIDLGMLSIRRGITAIGG